VISEATAAVVSARLVSANWALKSEIMGAAVLAQDDEHFWQLLGVATPDTVKVGPKGYIHGWIFVGAPGVGARVHHPKHGDGTVTAHDGKRATVKFDKTGETHTFEARKGDGKGKLVTRDDHAKLLADRVAKDPKEVGKLNDAELKDVDSELGRRAAVLGQPGKVSATHKKVKDALAKRAPEDEKIKTPWGTMHPADMLISHRGAALYSAEAARNAVRELDRRGATPHGMDKVSRARREAQKELEQHERWAKEAAKPGGRNDYHKAVADAKQADADAKAKGTADAHQVAADAHRKATSLAYTNDYNAASFHRQMTDLHQRSANMKRAEEAKANPPKAAPAPKAPKPRAPVAPREPKEQTPDDLSKRANRTGKREDHVKASVAQHQAGNRLKAARHREAVASIDASNEYKNEAAQHADAAERMKDPDLHKAAAQSYRNAAEHMDDVPGGRKAAADLRGQADEHDNIAQRIVKATANYVKSFLHANRTGHKADKKDTADAHRAAADAENEAAARAITGPQRRHHAAEAARHVKAAEALDAKTSISAA
jgi:hypothetical protein